MDAIDPAPYSAHLRVGTHEWDVTYPGDKDYGPLAGLKFAWSARQDDGWPTQHDPTVLVFGVIVEAGTDFDDVDQGTDVHFTFTPDGYTAPLVVFGGTVRDLIGHPHELGMVYDITAVDHLQKLQEDYTTEVFVASGDPIALVWTRAMQDAGGAGSGTGTRPALPDPFAGDVLPLSGGGFAGSDIIFEAVPTWQVIDGISRYSPFKAGATPVYQRPVVHYQLDTDGNLDATHPFEGTWLPQGPPVPVTLPAAMVATDLTQWSRPRIEPNRAVILDGPAAGTVVERDHDGVTITRGMTSLPTFLGNFTDPVWVTAGIEATDQWSTALQVQASRDPDLVAGWFDLPTALLLQVTVDDIDPRHTPTGSGAMTGMLGGAQLVIPERGDWSVTFGLRRTLPAAI